MTIPEEAYKSAIKAAGKSVSVEMHALPAFLDAIAAALEAAAPYLIQAAKAEAWDEGHLMGWNEATANELPERESLWRNPNR